MLTPSPYTTFSCEWNLGRQDSYWIRREHSAPEPLNRKGFLPTTYPSLPHRPSHFRDSDLYSSLPLRSIVYWWSSIIMLLCVGIEKKLKMNEDHSSKESSWLFSIHSLSTMQPSIPREKKCCCDSTDFTASFGSPCGIISHITLSWNFLSSDACFFSPT